MGDWQRQQQQQPLQNAQQQQQQQQSQPQPQPQPVPSPPTDVVVNSKRQRRPSVRLGEIGDLSAAYCSHDFLKKKPRPVSSSSGFSAKIPKTSRNQHHPSSAVNLSGDEDHDEGLSSFGFKDSSALRLAPVLLNKRLRHRRVRRREIKITSDSSNRHNLQQQQPQPQPQPQPSNGGNRYGKDFGCEQPSNGGNCYNKGFGYDNNGSGQDKGFEYDNGFGVSCDGYKDSDIDVATSGSPTNMKETCTIHLDSPKIHDEEEEEEEEEENDNEHLEMQYGTKQQDDLEEKMLASSSAVQYLGMVKDVRAWLSGLGLGRYAEVFEEHEVDKEVLPLLTLDDLKEMGITAVGARRKMFSAIQKLGKKFAAV